MHKEETKKLLSPEFLNQAAEIFALESASVKHIGGFENIMYEGVQDHAPVILRIAHNDHRTAPQIYSELHWLQFLKDNGANVCGPRVSAAGNLVETIEVQGTPLHLSLFDKAPGTKVDIRKERDNLKLFQAWGRATGLLHRLTKSYQAPPEILTREDDIDIFEYTLMPYIPNEPRLQEKIARIVQGLRAMPRTTDWYGLIHSDIHFWNFFYDGNDLHIFDFDDCCYHQLASDIAIPLYYSIWGNNLESQEERDEFGYVFAKNFLQGYRTEHPVSLEQVRTLPLLLQFRDCELLGVLMAEWEDNMDEKELELIESFKNRLLENRLIVNVDWEKLYIELK